MRKIGWWKTACAVCVVRGGGDWSGGADFHHALQLRPARWPGRLHHGSRQRASSPGEKTAAIDRRQCRESPGSFSKNTSIVGYTEGLDAFLDSVPGTC